MAITIYYQTVVNKEQNLQQVVQTGGFDNTQAIMDFDILLESVYPHKQFTVFLRKRRADLLPYLQVIRKAKLLRAKQTEMDELIIWLQIEAAQNRDGSAMSSGSGHSEYSNEHNINSDAHRKESFSCKVFRKLEKQVS